MKLARLTVQGIAAALWIGSAVVAEGGYSNFSWSSQQWVIDWENDNSLSIPLGVVLGKVFLGKTPWNISVEPYYTINNQKRPDEWGVKFQWTAIFPKFHW